MTYAHPEYDLDLFDAAGLLSAKVSRPHSTSARSQLAKTKIFEIFLFAFSYIKIHI